MGLFGGHKEFDPARDIPDLSGKVALVTGANSGIGASLVRALAAHNPLLVYLCVRNTASGEALAATVKAAHPKANLKVVQLDLASFASVKQCALQIFKDPSARLDYVFLNAGITSTSPQLTTDGYEHQFGTNHMGHAYFLQLLMPTVLATAANSSADVRVIVTSSEVAKIIVPSNEGGLVLDKMKTEAADMYAMSRYGHSKLANALFARQLARCYPSVISTSHNPGVVYTSIYSKTAGVMYYVFKLMSPFVRLLAMSPDQGAENGLWTAFVARDKIKNGDYYEPVGKHSKSKNFTDKGADELWNWTNSELQRHGAPGWPEP